MPAGPKILIRLGANSVEAKVEDDASSASLDETRDLLSRDTIERFQAWLDEDVPRLRSQRDFEVFGWHLYNFLFQGDIAAALRAPLRRALKERGAPLRVELEVEPKALLFAAIPWEFMWCPPKATNSGEGTFLGASQSVTFARTREQDPVELLPLGQGERARILIVVTQPKSPEFDFVISAPVVEHVRDTFGKTLNADVEVLENPRDWLALRAAVERTKPHIFHFMGHGEQDGESGKLAMFAGANPWMRPSKLIEALMVDKSMPRLVVLLACESAKPARARLGRQGGFGGVAPSLLNAGVAAIVAMQYKIAQRSAIDFSKNLYDEILKQRPIHEAVQAGRANLFRSPPEGADELDDDGREEPLSRVFGTPVLYMSSVDGVLFPRVAVSPSAEAIEPQFARAALGASAPASPVNATVALDKVEAPLSPDKMPLSVIAKPIDAEPPARSGAGSPQNPSLRGSRSGSGGVE